MGCDCESCEDACPCIGGFPQLWTMFISLLVGGGCLAGSSMYALISNASSVLNFRWPQPYAAYLNASGLGVAIGCTMLVLALLTWCAFRSEGFSTVFKYIFAGLLVLSFLGAIFTAVGAFQVFVGLSSQRSAFTRAFDQSWTAAIKERPIAVSGSRNTTTKVTCQVQDRLKCTAFLPGDCTGTRAGKIERCDTSCRNTSTRGCYFVVSAWYRKWNLPVACTAVIAALGSALSLVVLLTKVTFNLDEQKGDI